jgi:hypothetical protein
MPVNYDNLSTILSKIDNIVLTEEASAHINHVEDLVLLNGSNGAKRALNSMVNTMNNPKDISIKFDGYPALIFGNNANNKFIISDKHMFDKSDGSGRNIFSPKDFMNYDTNRGVKRDSLYGAVNNIWNGLKQSCGNNLGYYWGDLLFANTLKPVGNDYVFKPNPNGLTYKVKCDSNTGRLLENKVGGITVHQFINSNARSLKEAVQVNDGIGTLKNNSNVALLPSSLPMNIVIKLDPKDIDHVSNEISKCSDMIDELINSTPNKNILTKYINNKVRSGNLSNLYNDFYDEQYNPKITDYMKNNPVKVKALLTIWTLLYRLKMKVLQQLNNVTSSQDIRGYLDDGTQTQEGFVSQNLKYVDRMGYSRQNFGNNTV